MLAKQTGIEEFRPSVFLRGEISVIEMRLKVIIFPRFREFCCHLQCKYQEKVKELFAIQTERKIFPVLLREQIINVSPLSPSPTQPVAKHLGSVRDQVHKAHHRYAQTRAEEPWTPLPHNTQHRKQRHCRGSELRGLEEMKPKQCLKLNNHSLINALMNI